MLTMGQKIVAFGSLLFISGVSFLFSPLLSFLLFPMSLLSGIMLWKL